MDSTPDLDGPPEPAQNREFQTFEASVVDKLDRPTSIASEIDAEVQQQQQQQQ